MMIHQKKKRAPALLQRSFYFDTTYFFDELTSQYVGKISFIEQAASHCRINGRASIQGTFGALYQAQYPSYYRRWATKLIRHYELTNWFSTALGGEMCFMKLATLAQSTR